MRVTLSPEKPRVALVSNYPPRGTKHTSSGSAVSSYSMNLASSLVRSGSGAQVTVFANQVDDGVVEYVENGIGVVRCWRQGLLYPFGVFRHIARRRRSLDLIHIQHEYYLYGAGPLSVALFPLMLLLLKVLGKPLIVTLHGVISLAELDSAFLAENGQRGNARALRVGMRLLTKLICFLSDRVIVHEHSLERTLCQEYRIKSMKVSVIHHGIEPARAVPERGSSRTRLGLAGEKVVMFFGFLTEYKGIDTLIDAFASLPADSYTLLIVGGEHPRKQNSMGYQKYISRLREKAASAPNEIRFTGFVPEAEVPAYFSAADLIVLPYVRVMSASGPLTQCATHGRPFLLSDAFAAVVGRQIFLFRNDPEDLSKKITGFFASKDGAGPSLAYGRRMLRERSWENVGQETLYLYGGCSQ